MIPIEDLSPIAHPLAQKKLLKKLHKTIKRGALHIVSLFRFSLTSTPLKPLNHGRSNGVSRKL